MLYAILMFTSILYMCANAFEEAWIGNVAMQRRAVQLKHSWSYHGVFGPEKWRNEYSMCDDQRPESRQSPIKLQDGLTKYANMGHFNLSDYNLTAGIIMAIKNTGHTAQIDISGRNIQISGGGLETKYKAVQLHFHWGANSMRGSEHHINDTVYPMELHIVHYNTIFPDLMGAAQRYQGLAVLGFMFKVTSKDNQAYNAILNTFREIKEPDTQTKLEPFKLASILPKDLAEFYRYDGSLTTPACMESVTWTIFKSLISISEDQLKKFRSLLSSDTDEKTGLYTPLVDNFRPLQNLNKRLVFASFVVTDDSQHFSHANIALSASNAILVISLVAALRNLYLLRRFC